jgi:hypothetical protein
MASKQSSADKIKVPDLLSMFESQLVKRKVGIVEFAHSPEFCGKPLYPRQRTLLKLIFLEDLDSYDKKVIDEWIKSSKEGGEVTISPGIYDRYDYLRDHGFPHFRQIQLVGGRRSSKGHITGLATAKKIYDLTLIDNVGEHYGIDVDKDVYIQVVANSKEQAKAMQFADSTNWLLACKSIADQGLISKLLAETTSIFTPYDKQRVLKIESQQGKIDKDLAKIRLQAQGTNSRTLRGQAAIAYIFDEFAHFLSGESNMSAEEVYKAATPSLAQFGKDAMIFTNSSPYTEIGMFFTLYNNSLQLDPPIIGKPVYPDMLMLQYPSWELYKDWDNDPLYKWKGAIMVSPDISDESLANSDERIKAQQARFEEMANPESFAVEYRARFAKVIDAFLNPEMVDRAFDPEFTKSKVGRYIDTEYGAKMFSMYKAHGDPSSVVANFGIAVAHIEEVEEEMPDRNGGMFLMKVPHVVFDLVDAFYPEDFEEKTIDWMQVVPQIGKLINAFRPIEWTFDQFDSNFAIQQLNSDIGNMGITETQVYMKTANAANNKRRAMNFKAALNLGRIHIPHPTYPSDKSNKKSLELVRQELKFLQDKNGRIDKQEIGPVRTKDIADCLMECVDFLIGDSLTINMFTQSRPEFGSASGYGIGKHQDSPFSSFYEASRLNQKHDLARGGRFFNKRERPR